MSTPLEQRLAALQSAGLTGSLASLRRGLEKESLRVARDGSLAETPHPASLGSALTHPHLTTDYSEALLEFITPVFDTPEGPIDFLHRMHRFVYGELGTELLWVNSMPCCLGREESIRIAEYGTSHSGRLRHTYRHGLWHRYGRAMQTIAGIHYNVSFTEDFWRGWQDLQGDSRPLKAFVSDQYFHLIRNFQRHVSILIYLFGASPAVCASFLRGREHRLNVLDGHTLYAPWGTSLRMSDLGYHNTTQMGLSVSYDSLPAYVGSLHRAATTPWEAYRHIGIEANGEYRQLNANILQLENEYYASIRPKHALKPGQRTLSALAQGGVEYIEIRCMDLNPLLPVGIDADTLRLLDLFVMFCLLEPSAPLSALEYRCMHDNQQTIVLNGRNPAHRQACALGPVHFRPWAEHVLEKLAMIADALDGPTRSLGSLVRAQQEKLAHPELTTSARIVDLLESRRCSFTELGMEHAAHTARYFRQQPLTDGELVPLVTEAADSHRLQREIEAADTGTFADWLAGYLAQTPQLAPEFSHHEPR